jgi:DNA-binding NtrC family response regulator
MRGQRLKINHSSTVGSEIARSDGQTDQSTFHRNKPMTARILLTEDDEDVRDLVEMVLVDEGYQVDATDSVAGALSLLDSQSYDLLFTDGMLPDGTGLVIADRAKERDIEVVFFTGLINAFPEEELTQYTVLRKPGDMDNVIQTVAHVIAA